MGNSEILSVVAFLIGFMGVAALIEAVVPLFPVRASGRARRRANLGLTAITIATTWLLTSLTALAAFALPSVSAGLFARAGVPPAVQVVAGVVALDFAFGYFAHRAMHLSPLLWRFHRVHHADSFVDVTTSYRTHPFETVWRYFCMMVPVWLLGVPASALVVYRGLSAMNGIFEHANIRVRPGLDAALSRLWVTPNMHKVHHSRDARETDTNYGNILALFDRALGTFTPTQRALGVVYGLDGEDGAGPVTVAGLLAMPFAAPPRATRAELPVA